MCNHADVSEALESAHALAARIVSALATGFGGAQVDEALLIASALKDDLDAVRALHLRVVLRKSRGKEA